MAEAEPFDLTKIKGMTHRLYLAGNEQPTEAEIKVALGLAPGFVLKEKPIVTKLPNGCWQCDCTFPVGEQP